MKLPTKKVFFCFLGLLSASVGIARAETAGPRLQFNTTTYDFGVVKQDDPVKFSFPFRNEGDADLILEGLRTTCGCTAASASSGPFRPGESSEITATYDTRGKFGHTQKEITVLSNDPKSPHHLMLTGMVTGSEHPMKGTGDVLFSGSCAACHAVPAKGKMGKELYDATCFMCHDSPQQHGRSALAADQFGLAKLSKSDLKRVITHGVPGTSMSAFSDRKKGPLTKAQISSLVDYILSLKKD